MRPVGLVLLAALPLILWLHRRRRRTRRIVVPALTPWLALLGPTPPRRRRIPPTVLLALHLLAAGALALAVAGPVVGGGAGGRSWVDRAVVLDVSTSMAAGDRWAQAVAAAGELVRSTPGEVTLATLGPRPRVLVARDREGRAALRQLEALRPGGTGAMTDEAIRLARAAAGDAAEVVIVSDGAVPAPQGVGPAVRWELVGGPEDNLALLDVRAGRTAEGQRLFARLASFADGVVAVPLALQVDEQTLDERTVDLEPGGTFETVWDLPATARTATVTIRPDDALPADDRAVVPLEPSELRVQLVGRSDAVERALAARPDVRLERVGLGTFRVDGSADASVFVGPVPERLPPGGVLLFDPEPGTLLDAAAADAAVTLTTGGDHPLVAGLDLSGVSLAGLSDPTVPPWAEPVLTAEGQTVALAGTLGRSNVVAFALDPEGGDLRERLAFPLWVARALDWVVGTSLPAVVAAGQPVELPPSHRVVQVPGGRPVASEGTPFEGTAEPGLYLVRGDGVAAGRIGRFGVQAGDATESDLRRRTFLPQVEPAPAAALTGQELWPWLAALALAVCLVEGLWRAWPDSGRRWLGLGWPLGGGRPELEWARPEAAWLLLLALPAGWLEHRAGGRRGQVVLRMALVAAIALALAEPVARRGAEPPTIVLLDRSASVAPGAAAASMAELGRSAATGLLEYGDASASPLAVALDEARRALPEPKGGRVVLLTDGLATESAGWTRPAAPAARSRGAGAVVRAAALAATAGVRLDALALPAGGGRDAAVTALDVPAAWRRGEPLPVTVSARATEALSGTLALFANDLEVATEAVRLEPAGISRRFSVPAAGAGALRLRAAVRAEGDTVPGNDAAFGISHLGPPARVLLVGEAPDVIGLADELGRLGLTTAVLGPERLPGRLSALAEWDVLFLADVPASALGVDQLAAVEAFAAELGHGVVLSGGRQSFLPGGWESTPLEAMAPVELQPPPRDERDPVAMVLLIDQSASMGSAEGQANISKLDLAREAALLATEALHPGDRIGVVTYDDDARWLVPLATVGAGRELAEVESRIAALATGGGTRILRALELGLPALMVAGEDTRHAILLTDGRDYNPDPVLYDAQVGAARAAGVTLSAIAIGADADREVLARLARLGRGRYHSADDPGDLPRLALEESRVVRARTEQGGDFHALPAGGRAHPVLFGLDVGRLPALKGYLASRRRDGAAVVLEAPNGDPLLAGWNYGAGRVVAWMSDSGEEWAQGWLDGGEAARFWRRLIDYAAPAPDAGPLAVTVTGEADRRQVELEARDPAGRPLDLAEATLTLTGTTGVQTVLLPQVAPGLYSGEVRLPEPGAYPAVAQVAGAQTRRSAPVALVRNYPPELQPRPAGAVDLAAVAAAGGGTLLPQARGALPPVSARRVPLWPALLALALVGWVIGIAQQLGVGLPRRRRGEVQPVGRAGMEKEAIGSST